MAHSWDYLPPQWHLSPPFHSLYVSIASSPLLFYQIATVPVFWLWSILPSPFITPIPSLCNCLYPSPSLPPACSSSVAGVPGSAAADCGAMIQKPHINTGISPRDYLSVACLPGRVLLCNLYSTVNRVGLGERGFVGVEGWLVSRTVQFGLLGNLNISIPYGLGIRRWVDSWGCHTESEVKSLAEWSSSSQSAMYPSEVCRVI